MSDEEADRTESMKARERETNTHIENIICKIHYVELSPMGYLPGGAVLTGTNTHIH